MALLVFVFGAGVAGHDAFAPCKQHGQQRWALARLVARGVCAAGAEDYLRLRQSSLSTGSDFLDLVTFYDDRGHKQKGLEVAERGLTVGIGRLKELRDFVAEHAKNTGNRERYLALQFDQSIEPLCLDSYLTFYE